MNYLSPSVLSADFLHLEDDIKAAERGGAQYIHFDVMDGQFVPSISFGLPVLKAIRKATDLVLDVHLMIADPAAYIDAFADAGADIITFHVEADTHINRTIHKIHERGLKAGVVLNPGTSLSVLDYILEDVDMVLLMTVNPGFGGQAFIPITMQKIRDLRKIIDEKGLNVDIEVDGGVKLSNVQEVLDAGANVIVAGSAVFGKDTEANARAFMEILSK